MSRPVPARRSVIASTTAAGPSRPDWLSLGPAARRLGVDIDTVRRWVDTGQIESFTTPGGHRRISRRAVERLVRSRRVQPMHLANLGATPERLSAAYRRETRPRRGMTVPAELGLDDSVRDGLREDGRRLVAALLRALDAQRPSAREAAMLEIESLGADLGHRLAAAGVDLAAAVPRFIAGRGPILDELGRVIRHRRLDPERTAAVFRDGSVALDRALLAFVAAWPGAGRAPGTNGR